MSVRIISINEFSFFLHCLLSLSLNFSQVFPEFDLLCLLDLVFLHDFILLELLDMIDLLQLLIDFFLPGLNSVLLSLFNNAKILVHQYFLLRGPRLLCE